MSDETDAPKKPSVIEAPLTSWVKGGTNTTIHDNQIKQKRAEAEKRRQEEAARQQIADKDPIGARSSTTLLGGQRSHAAIVLEIRNSDGKAEEFITCELNAGREDPNELILVMCCLHCARRHGMDEANFHFSNKHRKFELDIRRQGELWVNPKDPREFVTLAGTIHLQEIVTCPTCAWRFVIDNSIVRTV